MKYRIKNLDKLLTQLADMSNPLIFNEEVRKALDKGSGVVADVTRNELQKLPVDNRSFVKDGRTSILQVQKDALLKSFGVTPIQSGKKDSINRKTGVSRTKNKLGQPNVTIARRLENGTSYMPKNPIFSRASRKARSECIKTMDDSLKKSINNIWDRR